MQKLLDNLKDSVLSTVAILVASHLKVPKLPVIPRASWLQRTLLGRLHYPHCHMGVALAAAVLWGLYRGF